MIQNMKASVYVGALLLLVLAVPVSAEEQKPPRPEFIEHQQERREQFLENQQERHDQFKENQGERHDLFKENQEERRDDWKEALTERRAELLSNLEDRKEAFKQSLEERKERFASTTAQWKAQFSEKTKELILNRARHAVDLFYAMLERLETLADRIEARLGELADDGVDTGEAETALTNARGELEDAKSAIMAFEDGLAEALDSEEPKENAQTAKALAETAKTALREAHQALKDVIRAIPKPEDTEDETESEETNS